MKKIILITLITILSNQLVGQNSEDGVLESLKRSFKLTKYDRPSIQVKFNKDTIIIAGYLEDLTNSSPRYQKKQNIIYKTTNGGLNWKQIKFDGDAWIYDTCHKKDGKIWMGGSDNYLHFSKDFGETWSKKPKPFNPINRVSSIFMVDSLYGIAGGLSNGLAITNDNWSTSNQVKTPIDQGKFKILKESSRNKVDKIAIINKIILINQNEYIFYSKTDSIDWKKFNVPVTSFSINEKKKEITLHSRNGKKFVLDSNLNLKYEFQENYLWEEIKNDNTVLNLKTFFESRINSINITSTKWLVDKHVHMGTIYKPNIQKGIILDKKENLFFKAKGIEKKKLEKSKDDIKSLLQDKNLKTPLSELAKSLNFTTKDFRDYKILIEKIKKERNDNESWGGNFTSQIELINSSFQDYQNPNNYLKQNYISSIYNQAYFPFLMEEEQIDYIEFRIENNSGKEILIDNKKSSFYSLPWTITYDNKSIDTYNPKITEFVRDILPTEFNNYENLLGRELIFKLIEEQIIDNLEYKNSY